MNPAPLNRTRTTSDPRTFEPFFEESIESERTSHRDGSNESGSTQTAGSRCTACSQTPAAHPAGSVSESPPDSPPSDARTPLVSFLATNGATGWSRRVSRRHASRTGAPALVRHHAGPGRLSNESSGSAARLARSSRCATGSPASRSSAHDSVADCVSWPAKRRVVASSSNASRDPSPVHRSIAARQNRPKIPLPPRPRR
mmetsp:Transcript_5639/g.23134  ORF Transcript_5639/g.23134 Transcript_5639/m.23134 type:complete len:200 (-) Transcript_5639:1172-1771(-)